MKQHLPLNVRVPIEEDNPSICRNESLCVKCGMCKEVCTVQIGVHGTYSLEDTGGMLSAYIAVSAVMSVPPPASPKFTSILLSALL